MTSRQGGMVTRRLSGRVRFATEVEVSLNGASYEAMLVDISLRGARIEVPESLNPSPGVQCDLTVCLNHSLIRLPFGGEFIHFSGTIAGIRFTRTDLSSMMHLRRLLELNTGDPERIRSELGSLVFD